MRAAAAGFVALIMVGVASGSEPDLKQAATKVRERLYRIRGIEGVFSLTQAPTEKFLAEYARDTKYKGNPEQLRTQFTKRVYGQFKELASGERWLESRGFQEGAERVEHNIIAHDAKQFWAVRGIPAPDEPRLPEVTLGRNILPEYVSQVPLRHLIGLQLLGTNADLAHLLDGGHAVVKKVTMGPDGPVWSVESTLQNRSVQVRYQLELDVAKDYAIRKVHSSFGRENENSFHEVDAWVVEDWMKVEATTLALWVPKKAHRTTRNVRGEVTFNDIVEFERVAINPRLKSSDFTPTIEPGSSVHDLKTGKITVHGNKASDRIIRLLKARQEESKREMEAVAPQVQHVAASVPSRGAWLAWTLGLVGTGCIAGAVLWKLWRDWSDRV